MLMHPRTLVVRLLPRASTVSTATVRGASIGPGSCSGSLALTVSCIAVS